MGDVITNTPIEVALKDFFKAFYLDDKKTIFFRTYNDKDKNEPGSKKEVALRFLDGIIPTLRKENSQNRGVYFVVNGGGQNDKTVLAAKSCTAQFMEMDKGTFEEQLAIINDFPLEPSILVRTKKSLHTYWLLNDGNIKRFREIQLQLAAKFNSDTTVQNESRVMRVPGFNHCKGEPVKVEIIHFKPELRYTQDELANLLPKVTPSKRKKNRTKVTKDGTNKIPHGQRRDYLKSKAGELVSRMYNEDDSTIVAALMNIARNDLDLSVPFDWEELEKDLYNLVAYSRTKERESREEKATPLNKILEKLQYLKPETTYKWDDKGNGQLFAIVFKDRVRWNVTAKEWFYFDGKVWKMDEGGMIAARCGKLLANALVVYSANSIQDDTIRSGYQGHVLKLGQLNNRKRMLEDARDKFFLTADMFDKDDYLLNLQNGVLDLRSGKFLEHDSNLLLSKICNASYTPNVRCKRWEKFVDEVMEGSQEKTHYLQKIIGYALTGDTKEETCYILYGRTTRNGKSTLVETIGYMMGGESGYALNMAPETLALKKNNDSRQASPDIARLKGCRFLNASEPPKRMIFDVGLLKMLLGRDTITARFLQKNIFQFTPCFKLFMNTNFLPLITDDTLFSSGRLNVISFDRHFSEQEQDKSLKDLFREPEAMSGILNWCLEGLHAYFEEGATPPEAVRIATEAYREISDKIGLFIGEVLDPRPGHNMSAGKVYELYQDWCTDNGYGKENKTNFFAELKSKGVFAPSGTVCGKTVRNVLCGYDVSGEYYNGNPITNAAGDTVQEYQYAGDFGEEIPFD